MLHLNILTLLACTYPLAILALPSVHIPERNVNPEAGFKIQDSTDISSLLAKPYGHGHPLHSLTTAEKAAMLMKESLASTEGFTLDLNDMRLLSFGQDEEPVWMSEMGKIKAKAEGRKFMDITDTPMLGMTNALLPSKGLADKYTYPTPGNSTKLTKFVKSLYPGLSTKDMKTFLTEFSSFRTRYYRSSTGKDSQLFLLKTIKEIAKYHPSVTVTEFEHPWGQNSIIAHFPASSSVSKDAPLTIVGAHQDSTALIPWLPAPGADDDGSGTTSTLFAFKALAHANFTPSTGPVEFQWYSAEEGGLLGSQAVAQSYEQAGKKVQAMIQLDMTAWIKTGTKEVVGIITDFVDPVLTEFNKKLVDEYLDIPYVETKCGYACSDHASYSKANYPSSFAIESTFEESNHGIHSSADVINHEEFSFDHIRQYSMLSIAFAVELGGL